MLGIVISFLVFSLQIFFNFLWLQHFHVGPLEWTWRSITYGQLQSIRINYNYLFLSIDNE